MLTFKCATCGKTFDCSLSNIDNTVSYLNGSKYIELKHGDEDCSTCIDLIEQEIVSAKEKARQKLREAKNA